MFTGYTGRETRAAAFGGMTAGALPLVFLLLFSISCNRGKTQLPAIGTGYVGPSALKIRGDIPLEAPTVATLKHGDRVEIIQKRRRFLKVRAKGGIEGWTHERQLLSTDEMNALEDLADRAAKMPVQGQATSNFDLLNIHTLPNRQSPSFEQVKEKEKIDVLAHIVAPRKEIPRQPLLPPPPPKKAKVPAKPPKEPKYPPPPVPPPPKPPANWLELSKTDLDGPEDDTEEDEPEPPPPAPMDHWTLVRLHDGQAGWALTGRLVMAIPDEVAQYAEGRRIVSYFPLGEIQDEDQKKNIWLWTTVSGGVQPYDFDSFRVFVWSLRRHRYETAYIERNLQGFAPVLLEKVEMSSGSGARSSTEKYSGFSVCVQKSDGKRYRRSFALIGNIVRFAGEQACEAAPPVYQTAIPAGAAHAQGLVPPAPEVPHESLSQRVRKQFQTFYRRLRGK